MNAIGRSFRARDGRIGTILATKPGIFAVWCLVLFDGARGYTEWIRRR